MDDADLAAPDLQPKALTTKEKSDVNGLDKAFFIQMDLQASQTPAMTRRVNGCMEQIRTNKH